MEHAWPEEGVKIGDVFADEVMDFGRVAFPPIVEVFVVLFAPLPGGCDVADRRIEPNVPIVSRAIWDFESKVGSGARDVPVAERFA